MSVKLRRGCALCDSSRLDKVLSLAPTPLANEFVMSGDRSREQDHFPLDLLFCDDCGHVQLAHVVEPRRLFENYVYVSGTSPVFVDHFVKYAGKLVSRFSLGGQDLVVEIGSNDGTLLKQLQRYGLTNVLGVDPARKIAGEATTAGVPTIPSFFDSKLAVQIRRDHGAAAAVIANNVFAHVEDLRDIAEGVKALIGAKGFFVFEVSYFADVLRDLLFDICYHEHLSYHTVRPLISFFERLGMRLFDVEKVDTHGGSIRLYACHEDAKFRTEPSIGKLVDDEVNAGIFGRAVYTRFKERIGERGSQLRGVLADAKAAGKKVAGFGAPAKLTTLMYEFGLDGGDFEFIIDDSPWKQGLFTPGKHLAVMPSQTLYERPDVQVCVVFAWNFFTAIVDKHPKWAGSFVNPISGQITGT